MHSVIYVWSYMSMSLTIALLAMLELSPLSGYDLNKRIEASVVHFWSADQSQIYRTLARLVTDGLAEVTVIAQDGKPDRREHRITPTGRTALDAALRAPLEPESPHEAFLMRLFFADGLGIDGVRGLLRERRDAAAVLLSRLTVIADRDRGEPNDIGHALRRATLRNGIVHAEAELAWLDETDSAVVTAAS